jgi:hypothetical protein
MRARLCEAIEAFERVEDVAPALRLRTLANAYSVLGALLFRQHTTGELEERIRRLERAEARQPRLAEPPRLQ